MRVEVAEKPAIVGELTYDWSNVEAGPQVVLRFGAFELGRWNVADRKAEFEEQPGDHWSDKDREKAKYGFVSKFLGEKLQAIFAGLVP